MRKERRRVRPSYVQAPRLAASVQGVNIAPDRSGRTLLAWRCLVVMCRFMPVDLIPLHAITRQRGGGWLPERRLPVTSEERREARYERRQARRAEKKAARCSDCDDFDKVFSYAHLYEAYRKCRRNVAWKASVQKYITQAPLWVYQAYKRLHAGTWRSGGFFEFDISERGKLRHIRSVTIGERVVQRCLCDYALVPMLSRSFIYDNAASLRDKGYHFAVRRLCLHLRQHYRKHGTKGYVLLFDFRKFFDNVSHALCKDTLRKAFTDRRVVAITEHFIDMFGDRGLGLGSQISQVFALASANRLDHYIKDECGIRGYGRYMDDGYIIHESKARLREILVGVRRVCAVLGIELNERKTRIVRLARGFPWLKTRFFLTDTGKVVRKMPRDSITRERRKLKKLAPLFLSGKLEIQDVRASWQSWRAYAENFNAYRTIRRMQALLMSLFVRS